MVFSFRFVFCLCVYLFLVLHLLQQAVLSLVYCNHPLGFNQLITPQLTVLPHLLPSSESNDLRLCPTHMLCMGPLEVGQKWPQSPPSLSLSHQSGGVQLKSALSSLLHCHSPLTFSNPDTSQFDFKNMYVHPHIHTQTKFATLVCPRLKKFPVALRSLRWSGTISDLCHTPVSLHLPNTTPLSSVSTVAKKWAK